MSHYRSDDDEVLTWWEEAERGQREFQENVDAWKDTYGMGREIVLLHGWGTSIGGLEVHTTDEHSPPTGWRVFSNNRFEVLIPLRRTKAGKALYDEMTSIRVGDPRMKLPGWEWRLMVGMPGLFLHDGSVWMDSTTDDGIDRAVWSVVPRSEFLIAQGRHAEAAEARLSAAGSESR